MDIHGKSLESMGQRYLHSLNLRSVLNERLMTSEPEIDYISLIPYCLLYIRLHKEAKLIKVRDSPDNVIAEPYVIERIVQFGYPA